MEILRTLVTLLLLMSIDVVSLDSVAANIEFQPCNQCILSCKELAGKFCQAIANRPDDGTPFTYLGSELEDIAQASQDKKVRSTFIYLGHHTRNSSLWEREYIDLMALVNAKVHFPSDIANAIDGEIDQLKTDLLQPGRINSQAIKKLREQINQKLEGVAKERLAKHPGLRLSDVIDDVHNDVARAKYVQTAGGPATNFARVQKVFGEALSDAHQMLNALPLKSSLRQQKLAALDHITLAPLPPNREVEQGNCQETGMQARYIISTHTLTVCAGLFNTYQADDALYGIVAREIARAISSEALQPNRILTALENEAPFLNCGELAKALSSFKTKQSAPHQDVGYNALRSCFQSQAASGVFFTGFKWSRDAYQKTKSRASQCGIDSSNLNSSWSELYHEYKKKRIDYQEQDWLTSQMIAEHLKTFNLPGGDPVSVRIRVYKLASLPACLIPRDSHSADFDPKYFSRDMSQIVCTPPADSPLVQCGLAGPQSKDHEIHGRSEQGEGVH